MPHRKGTIAEYIAKQSSKNTDDKVIVTHLMRKYKTNYPVAAHRYNTWKYHQHIKSSPKMIHQSTPGVKLTVQKASQELATSVRSHGMPKQKVARFFKRMLEAVYHGKPTTDQLRDILTLGIGGHKHSHA
jgi:hypothetical protein